MKLYDEERKLGSNTDLGWLFDLPEGVLRVYYGNLVFLDKTYLRNVGGTITFGELYIWMRDGIDKLLDKVNFLRETIVKDHKEAEELINKHKKLMSKYYIKEALCCTEGGHLKVHILFENYTMDTLFCFYHRTNSVYEDGGRMLRVLNKIIDDGEVGVKKYQEWLKVAELFNEHSMKIGWYKYFRIKDKKLYLKGKEWLDGWEELGSKLADICNKKIHKNKSDELYIDYDGIEELETLLNLLEG